MEKKITYTEAFNELEQIITEMEDGSVSVDALTEKVKRAATLIAICKKKLTSTEEDVNRILKELEDE
jgi:exodeoxyribonuclease VII small subunit